MKNHKCCIFASFTWPCSRLVNAVSQENADWLAEVEQAQEIAEFYRNENISLRRQIDVLRNHLKRQRGDKELDTDVPIPRGYDAMPDWLDEVDFNVVAVSVDNSRLLSKAKSFTQGRGWGEDFILLFDKNEDFKRAMNVSVVPHVFVVDQKGKVVFSHTSYVQGGEVELLEALKKLK